MRVSCSLALLCVIFCGFDSVQGRCIPEQCVPTGQKCSMMYGDGYAYEHETKKVKCEFLNSGTLFPGEHKAYCCTSKSAAEKHVRLVGLKNQARALYGASPNEYPHQVRFVSRSLCGGTVYNKEWIITAAHCVRNLGDINAQDDGSYIDVYGRPAKALVIAGQSHVTNATNDDKYIIDRIIRHQKWDPMKINKGNDIALLHLSRPLSLEVGKIQPMRLEPADYIPPYGGQGFAIGYGNVDKELGDASDDLMEAMGPIHSNTKAVALAALNPELRRGNLPTVDHLSIGGEDSGLLVGQGDSGGPFICPDENNKPILCGIASFKPCEVFKMCERPSYYLRVSPFLKWIRDETQNAKQESELFFDKTMLPDRIPDSEAPSYLVRIGGPSRSCTGTLVAPKVIITAAECVEANGGSLKYVPNLYHIKSGKILNMRGSLPASTFERDISKNISMYMKQNLNKMDVAAVYLRQPIETEYAKFAPRGYQVSGESDEYSYNDKTNALERRHYVSAGEEDCTRRFNGVDENVQLDFTEQLCMRQVYSAEANCKRDIGGPLMCEGGKYFCGVKSFQACKYPGMPAVFGATFGPNMIAQIDRMIKSAP